MLNIMYLLSIIPRQKVEATYGPGETDDPDLGLWCGPTRVNLKKGTETLGSFSYEEILPQLKKEIDQMILEKYGELQPN